MVTIDMSRALNDVQHTPHDQALLPDNSRVWKAGTSRDDVANLNVERAFRVDSIDICAIGPAYRGRKPDFDNALGECLSEQHPLAGATPVNIESHSRQPKVPP